MLAAIERERATTCLLVPTMLNALLNAPTFGDHDLSSLRLVFYGGGPMPLPVLRRAIEAIGCSFTQGYGLTETIEATFLTAADHALDGEPARERRLASAGREAVNAEVRVVDDDGADLGPGELGEILIRSPSVIREYWRAPEATAAALRDGWFHTGDIGHRRRRRLPVRRRPQEGRDHLRRRERLPQGRRGRALRAPRGGRGGGHRDADEHWGEVVTAVVVTARGGRGRGAARALPRAPRGLQAPARRALRRRAAAQPSGKILKRELRAMSLADLSARNARLYPDKPAFVMGSRTVTFAEHHARATALAADLAARGVPPGGRIAVLARNCLEYLDVYAAAETYGYVVAPLNFRLTREELAGIVAGLEPARAALPGGVRRRRPRRAAAHAPRRRGRQRGEHPAPRARRRRRT